MRRRRPEAADLARFAWVAPLPGPPLLADLQALLVGLGLPEVGTRYSGGSLMSVVNYMAECDAHAVLPHSVIFAQRKEARIGVVPFEIPQPARSLGVLRRPPRATPRPIASPPMSRPPSRSVGTS